MSIPNLPVDFKDDILASSNTKRKYRQTTNGDSTVSFEDVTNYSQEGSRFGAKEVNQTNTAINNIYDERVLDVDALELITEPGFFVDAQAVQELNGKISILNAIDMSVGSAIKVNDRTGQTNLTYGFWNPGIYLYPGKTTGAPSTYDGLLLVFKAASGSFCKVAFGFDCKIYMLRQSSDGTVTQNWVQI